MASAEKRPAKVWWIQHPGYVGWFSLDEKAVEFYRSQGCEISEGRIRWTEQ